MCWNDHFNISGWILTTIAGLITCGILWANFPTGYAEVWPFIAIGATATILGVTMFCESSRKPVFYTAIVGSTSGFVGEARGWWNTQNYLANSCVALLIFMLIGYLLLRYEEYRWSKPS